MYKSIKELFTAIADELRERLDIEGKIPTQDMPQRVQDLYFTSFNNGRDTGESIGYTRGYSEGEIKGREQGLTEGKEQGKAEVYTQIEPINEQLENTLYGEDIDVAGTVVNALDQNVNQANSDFVAIKGKIVEKGVEVAEGTRTAEYASKVDEVYEKGEQAQYDEFWDALQYNKGGEANYQYAFCNAGWNDITFKPKYDIVFGLGFSGTNAFWGSHISNIAEALERQGVKMDTTLCGYVTSMFQNAKTKRIPELNFTHATDYNPNGLQNTFTNSEVETIDKIIVTEAIKYTSTFKGCTQLKDIVFEGVIGQNIDFQWSTKLSKASWISIINALSATATGKSITGSLESVKREFETSEGAMDGDESAEWLGRISDKSNWTINLV